MTKTCPGSYREVGPYNQTLFLGCSVSSFTMNLGWASDASSMNITVVEDKAFHPTAAEYQGLNALVSSTNSVTNQTSTALRVNNADGTVSNADSGKNLHKTISHSLEQQNKDNDNGKIYWNQNTKKFWKDPDPGFLGLPKYNSDNTLIRPGYDIIGVPVYFKFDDSIAFGGMLSNWKAQGSQGGSPIFEIEIKSYASLLGGCQLIIDSYTGSISTSINDNIAVPSIDIGTYSSNIV